MSDRQWIALGMFLLSCGLIISEMVNRTIASMSGALFAFIFIVSSQGLLRYVFAVATYERITEKKIVWGYYCKVCYPAMILVAGVCSILLYLLHG